MNHPCDRTARIVLACLLMAVAHGPVAATADTPLDQRRLAMLQQYDAWQQLGPEDPQYPSPNRTIVYPYHQTDYQAKVLAIFGLVQHGRAPASRLDEANRLLRYEIHAWPANGPGSVIGQYAGGWNHRERSLGARLYYLYREYMDLDIRQDFENRLAWSVGEPFMNLSENIKFTTNALIYLAHEATGQTQRSSFTNVKSWLLDHMRSLGFRRPSIVNEGNWLEWAASNYRPPTIVEGMYLNTYRSETYLTNADRWHMHSYVMDRAAISTHHTIVNNYYGNPNEIHDIIQCIVQSSRSETSHVLTHAIHPNTLHTNNTSKMRSHHDRSFGYQNVAIVNGGADTKRAWSGYTMLNVPIRLFHSHEFSVTFDAGWAFLTDGDAYVAWAPTLGNPIPDPDSAAFNDPTGCGSWLRSDYTPPAGSEAEAAIVEVGDPESFGSFLDFRNEIKARNPRPRWTGDRVVYTTRDATVLDVGTNYVTVNGSAVTPATYPRADSTLGIADRVFSTNGQTVEFDFDNLQVHGTIKRLAAARYYGFSRPIPMSDFDADGDVDQTDFGHVQTCLNSTQDTPPAPGCEDTDLDGDGYVGSIDVSLLVACMNGANQIPGCLDGPH